MSEGSTITLKQFLFRFWIWHFSVTCIFFVLVVMIARPNIAALKGTHQDLIIILSCLLLSIVHTLLILIFSMKRFSGKQHKPGLIYLLHFFGSAGLAYYTSLLFVGGVFENILPG